MVTVMFTCHICGITKHRVEVPARTTEDVMEWTHNTAYLCGIEHKKLSPSCTEDKADLYLPAPPEAEFIGQQIEYMEKTSTGFDFDDPIDMLLYLDKNLLLGSKRGGIDLHQWQVRVMKDFAAPSSHVEPFQAVARTCNGAGKDQMLIAPCATWLCNKYPYAQSVITSKSGPQLDKQTNTRIQQLCEAMNTEFGREIWKINYRHYENLQTRSTIELFVTDEAGRAEGWHPKVPNGQQAIFTSEAKSIEEEIFHALSRCTGTTKRLDCSTPGLPMGHFFDRCTSGDWRKYHVTAFECPHISEREINDARNLYGDGSPLFKSMILAEFASTDEMVVIPYFRVMKAMAETNPAPWVHEEHNNGGLDLSAGGDETVLAVRNGNKLLKVYGWRYDDTSRTVDHVERLLSDNGLKHPQATVWADAGGLGKPIIDQLRKRGWYNIKYVINQGTPNDKRVYLNRGTEIWFTFNKWLENGEIILLPDERLKRQLSTRYYVANDSRYRLESKLQARAKGHPSPDRADAVVLAFSGYRSRFVEGVPDDRLPLPPRVIQQPPSSGDYTLKGAAGVGDSSSEAWLKRRFGYHSGERLDDSYIREQLKEANERRKQLLVNN